MSTWAVVWLAGNILPCWWFISNLGEKGNPTIWKQIANMGAIFVREPKCLPIIFGVGAFFWPVFGITCMHNAYEHKRKEKARKEAVEHVTTAREDLIAEFLEKKRKEGRQDVD